MTSKEINHILGKEPIIFPDEKRIWKIDRSHLTLISSRVGKETTVESIQPKGRTLYSWHPDGPIAMLSSDDIGILFASRNDADSLIPKIRLHGVTKDTFFWFLAMDAVEINLLFERYGAKSCPSIIGGETYELAEGRGYVDRMGGYGGHWFHKRGDFQAYESGIAQLEAML